MSDPVVDTIIVAPSPMILVTSGAVVQFTAEPRDESGSTIWGYPVSWAKSYNASNMEISSTGRMTAPVGGGGGTNYVQITIHNAFNQTKVAINPGSYQVLCYDPTWLGWAVFGDCQYPSAVAGSTQLVRFRVVDGLNQDIPNAGMNFSVSTGAGTVTPSSLTVPTIGVEYHTYWTLDVAPGPNVIQAGSFFGSSGVHMQGVAPPT
jgi:hypothetical protein